MKHILEIVVLSWIAVSTRHSVLARTFTVYNNCPFTIWPAVFTDLNVGTAVPDVPTGWEATQFSFRAFEVPDNWQAGRIWGRRDCNFTAGIPGPTQCLTGGCNGGLLCDPHTGTGVPPATVAEWTLSGANGNDFYDVSLVDGYDLPMSITNTQNCPIAGCFVDLGPNCPSQLRVNDTTGFPIGCKSSCNANLDGNPANSPNCCTGSFNTPSSCPSSTVEFYSYFKGNCPDTYAYAFDESSGTALFTCPTSLLADFTLTFCPPPLSSTNSTGASSLAISTTFSYSSSSTSPAADSNPTETSSFVAPLPVASSNSRPTARCTPTVIYILFLWILKCLWTA